LRKKLKEGKIRGSRARAGWQRNIGRVKQIKTAPVAPFAKTLLNGHEDEGKEGLSKPADEDDRAKNRAAEKLSKQACDPQQPIKQRKKTVQGPEKGKGPNQENSTVKNRRRTKEKTSGACRRSGVASDRGAKVSGRARPKKRTV